MNAQTIQEYLALRRAAGFSLHGVEAILTSFLRFAEQHGDYYVKTETAIAWAAAGPSQTTRESRLRVIRSFARFLSAEESRHEIPPRRVFEGAGQRRVPYIFTDEEIRLLVSQAGQLDYTGSFRARTYSLLFGSLAATGMRIGEALALHVDDLKGDYLHIRQTKFHKTRLVPLHPTCVRVFLDYIRQRPRPCKFRNLFVNEDGRPLSYSAAIETFHKVCAAAQLPRQGGNWRLRLHDLRHTFAVRTLEASPDSRVSIAQHTLALTTYMGHARVASTYWYMQATPVLMLDIARKSEEFMQGGPRCQP